MQRYRASKRFWHAVTDGCPTRLSLLAARAFALTNDADEATKWTLDSMEDYATFSLNGAFHIRGLELVTDASPDSFEIWGGSSQVFSEDSTKIKLSDGESLTQMVGVANVTKYITVKPSREASLPISLQELNVLVEKKIRLVNISDGVASDAGLNDGIYESVKTENASVIIGAESTPAALQIYFGDSNEGRRNIVVLGGTDAENLTPIAKLGTRSVPTQTPYTLLLNEEQSLYRYFALQKEMGAISGGVNVGGVYQFAETDAIVDVEEIMIW